MRMRRWKTLRGFLLELSVVVVGILIALGLDRTNEWRKDRAAEGAYLSALADDLAADTAALTRVIGTSRGHRDAARRVTSHLNNGRDGAADPGALAWDINYAGWVNYFTPSDFAYRELLSTGRLGLIRDAGLRRDILAYYGQIESYEQFYPVWSRAPQRYRPEVSRLLPPSDWELVASSRGRADSDGLDVAAVLGALRGSDVVRNALVSIAVVAEQQIETWEALRARAADLLARVRRSTSEEASRER